MKRFAQSRWEQEASEELSFHRYGIKSI